MRGEAFSAAGKAEPVRRGRTHRDPIDGYAHRPGEAGAHRIAHRRDARLLSDQHAIGVHELVTRALDNLVRALEKPERRSVEPLWIGGGKEVADVATARGAEDGVDERVGENVAVGVAGEPALAREVDAAEYERDVVAEAVGVEPNADSKLAHGD